MKLYAPFWLSDTGLPNYSGGVYDKRYVEALARTFKEACKGEPFELVLMVDKPAARALEGSGISTVLFEGWGIGGWSNVLEFFRPSLTWDEGETRRVAVGLDTIATGDVRWLWTEPRGDIVLPRDPLFPNNVCDAVISWTPQGAQTIWQEFLWSRVDGMKKHRYMGLPSEMALLRDLWSRGLAKTFEEQNLGQKLASYKCHIATGKRRLEAVELVYFHGRPKPSDLKPDSPLGKLWNP